MWVKHGLVIITKVPGVENVAELGTKYLDVNVAEKLREAVGLRQCVGVQSVVREFRAFISHLYDGLRGPQHVGGEYVL